MTKLDIENLDPNDSHSINISVYKPDGILSFWNWFTRRNKNDGQRKSIKLKINKEDFDKMKLSGFDFQKLQNLDASNKSKTVRQCNVISIPKTDLDPFLLKNLHPIRSSKAYVKRLISKSTISIRSKESCANFKYVQTIRSQKSVGNSVQSSKASFKVSMRSNTNIDLHTNEPPRNVFLKSVPTTILKSNTKKLPIFGKGKPFKGNKTSRTNASETFNSQQPTKANLNFKPLLLTQRKSKDEQVSDTENKKTKINKVVSQTNVIKKNNSQNDSSNTEQNRQKASKFLASHKIYSKNIHAPRKKKKNRPKKLKNQSNTNIPSSFETQFKPKPHNNGFAFNYFSDSSNEFKNTNDLGYSNVSKNKPGLLLNPRGFTLPNNISKVEFPPENASKVGCDLIMNVVKALTETKGSTNLKQIDSSITQNNQKYPNIGTGFGVFNLGGSKCISKSTFDWKHPRVSTTSEPHISESGKSNQENIKAKKNMSATFGKQDLSNDLCARNDILNQILNPNLQKQLVLDLLRNSNIKSLPVQDKTKTIGSSQNRQMEKLVVTDEPPNSDLEVTECNQGNNNVNDIDDCETGFKKKGTTTDCLCKQNSAYPTTFTESHKEINKLKLGQEQFQSVGLQGNNTLTDEVECLEMVTSTDRRGLSLHTCEDNNSALCSVSINHSAAIANSPEKLLKRTTISCSKAKKEPQVSITILVQDSMKGEVEMKSNVLKNTTVFKHELVDQSLKEDHSPPLSIFGPRGDNLSTVGLQSNACKTESFCSVESLSSVSCVNEKQVKVSVPKITVQKSPYSRKNKNFYVEVEDDGKQTFAEETLNLGSPGTYLNLEKRKILEEKVLGCNKNRSLVQTLNVREPVSPTKSRSNISNRLTSFDHMIETSFIRQETSYSKTKFNICKENKYNSKSALKPLESSKRCRFSDESLNTENAFDFSTKYTSQQCVMYCRNNSLANFKRPKFPLFQEKSSKNIELEQRKQPFVIVQTLKTNRDNTEVDTKRNRVWQNRVGFDVHDDRIVEVSEDESVGGNKALAEQQRDEINNIEIKTSHISLKNDLCENVDTVNYKSSDENVQEDKDRLGRQSHKVHHVDIQAQNEGNVANESKLVARNTSIMCDFGLSDSERKDASSATNEPRNKRATTTLSSRISQTNLASALVQTDWSLVGITVDHFNCSNDKSESIGCKKRTVASQTDVMMDQIALMNKDLDTMHNSCKTCMKSGQFSELVACNVTVSQATSLQETPQSVLDNRQVALFSENQSLKDMQIAGVLATFIKEKDLNSLEYTTSSLPINVSVLESNLQEHVETPTLSGLTKKQSCKLNLVSEYCENQSEESLIIVKEDFPHRCTIPCLTTLSDETIMSSLSESSNRITSRGIQDNLTVPQILAINRGICSYYNSLDEKRASNQLLSPILESRPSTSDTNSAFVRVIVNDVDDDEEPTQDELCIDSLTSSGASESVKDSTVEIVNMSPDCPDTLEDEKKHFVDWKKLEHVSETKKVIENTKEKQRKLGIKNILSGKSRKREEVSSVDKFSDYKINYLSVDRCDDEKKGNSLFSQT